VSSFICCHDTVCARILLAQRQAAAGEVPLYGSGLRHRGSLFFWRGATVCRCADAYSQQSKTQVHSWLLRQRSEKL